MMGANTGSNISVLSSYRDILLLRKDSCLTSNNSVSNQGPNTSYTSQYLDQRPIRVYAHESLTGYKGYVCCATVALRSTTTGNCSPLPGKLSLQVDVAVAAGGSGTAHTVENDGRVTNVSKHC